MDLCTKATFFIYVLRSSLASLFSKSRPQEYTMKSDRHWMIGFGKYVMFKSSHLFMFLVVFASSARGREEEFSYPATKIYKKKGFLSFEVVIWFLWNFENREPLVYPHLEAIDCSESCFVFFAA